MIRGSDLLLSTVVSQSRRGRDFQLRGRQQEWPHHLQGVLRVLLPGTTSICECDALEQGGNSRGGTVKEAADLPNFRATTYSTLLGMRPTYIVGYISVAVCGSCGVIEGSSPLRGGFVSPLIGGIQKNLPESKMATLSPNMSGICF